VLPAFRRYRVLAYVVGVLLLLLCAGVVVKYGFAAPGLVALVGPIHGFLYIVYLIAAGDLSLRARFPLWFAALVLLAGTVPFLSFYVERLVERRLQLK
jgi:integral membrane protein